MSIYTVVATVRKLSQAAHMWQFQVETRQKHQFSVVVLVYQFFISRPYTNYCGGLSAH